MASKFFPIQNHMSWQPCLFLVHWICWSVCSVLFPFHGHFAKFEQNSATWVCIPTSLVMPPSIWVQLYLPPTWTLTPAPQNPSCQLAEICLTLRAASDEEGTLGTRDQLSFSHISVEIMWSEWGRNREVHAPPVLLGAQRGDLLISAGHRNGWMRYFWSSKWMVLQQRTWTKWCTQNVPHSWALFLCLYTLWLLHMCICQKEPAGHS